jgi:hypothetical protein
MLLSVFIGVHPRFHCSLFAFVQQLKRQNTPHVRNSLFLWQQRVARFSGVVRTRNSVTIRATRPLGRETVRFMIEEVLSVKSQVLSPTSRTGRPSRGLPPRTLHFTLPTGCRRGFLYKRSQFPGSARRGGAQGRGTRGNCAKRTQFAADGRRTPSSRPKALAMPPVTGARARNKANSSPGPGGGGSETCETNPIWLVGRRPGKGNAQNEPNSPAAPAGTRLGGRGVLYKQTQLLRYADPEIGVPGRAILRNKANRLEPIVRNKPNLVRRAGPRRGETCETKPNLGRMGDLGNGVSGR